MRAMQMKTHRSHGFGWRAIGMLMCGLLFALSTAELIFRPGENAATWRCLALSSLYLVMCLSQRRLFAPARTNDNLRRRG
jgi:hypothetical protein